MTCHISVWYLTKNNAAVTKLVYFRTFRNSWYKWVANFHFNTELIFGVHIIAQFLTFNRPHTTKQHTNGGIASS